MKTTQILEKSAKGYVLFSLLSLAYVSILGIIDPQQVMDMVQVSLTNTDAISSIRGVYGGVGITICCFILFLFFKKHQWALSFLVGFWGCYAMSRVLTILIDGSLGDFGTNWLLIECCLFFIGACLLISINLLKKTDEMVYSFMD